MASSLFTFQNRAAGVLLHPTSLPGPHGCGDLGAAAHEFVDFLAAARQRWWQMLPIGPVGPDHAPYSSSSAFAGNPLLINLDELVHMGLVAARELKKAPRFAAEKVEFDRVRKFREGLLRQAFAAFAGQATPLRAEFEEFCRRHDPWLSAHALFTALSTHFKGKPWTAWPPELRRCEPPALVDARAKLTADFACERFVQFLFDRQWNALKSYANQKGVGLIGDIPIFVAHESSDVWAHAGLFQLDENSRPVVVSGCPPDNFSKNGQLWGHPLYNWPMHERTGFSWWIARFRLMLERFDAVRIDHFLGFHRCWEVPGKAKTAKTGRYVFSPGRALLSALRSALGKVEIIAEDLGATTPEATRLRDDFGLPGMRILQNAFGAEARYDQPHNHARNCVVYTGTHDNDTTVGWFKRLPARAPRPAAAPRKAKGADKDALPPLPAQSDRQRLMNYLGTSGKEIHWDLIRLAYSSPARTAIVPVQDVLGLDSKARMNTPATTKGNWEWRLAPKLLRPELAARLAELADTFERIPSPPAVSAAARAVVV